MKGELDSRIDRIEYETVGDFYVSGSPCAIIDPHFSQLAANGVESEPGKYGGNGRGHCERKRPPDKSPSKFFFGAIAVIALCCGLCLFYGAIYISISYGIKNG